MPVLEETTVIYPIFGKDTLANLKLSSGCLSRIGCKDQWNVILAGWNQEDLREAEAVVRESGIYSTITFLVPQPEGIFSRARTLNRAALACAGNFILFLDSDMALNREFIEQSTEALNYDKKVMVCANIRQLHRNAPCGTEDSGNIGRMIHGSGGVNWLHSSTFKECGGFDPFFYGWGSEEFEFTWRWEAQGRKIVRPAAIVHHLWHPLRKDPGYMARAPINREYFLKKKSNFKSALVTSTGTENPAKGKVP